jgi:MFS transporter, DHA2 family, multidrug resistance protein
VTDAPTPRLAGRREYLGLGVLALAALLYSMDLTVLHLAVPAISRNLRPSSAELLWIIDIYGFMVAGFLITMGTLGDRIGRRKILLIGGAWFGAASVLAAFSTSPGMLIASRALLGVAGATIAPSTLSLIFVMFEDPRQRTAAIGVWISAFSAGGAIGPVIGGLLLQQFWWGSVFLIAVPVMALLLLLGPRVLPEYRDPDAGRLDLVSAGLSLTAVLALIFGLKQIAQDGPGPLPIAAIGLGVVVGAVWARRQLTAADPMFDLRLFRIPRFRVSLVVNFLTIFVAVGYFLFVAQYLQLVLGLSPLEAGIWSVPSAIGFVVGSNLAPRIVRRIRPAHVMGAGLLVAGAGLAILSRVSATPGESLPVVVASSVVISLGLAPLFGLTTELIVGSAPPERAGAATGMSETAAELGGALGLSILGSIGVVVYRAGIAADLPTGVPSDAAAAARDTLGGAAAVAAQLPGTTGEALLAVARQAFVDGMQVVSLLCVVIAGVVAAVAVLGLHHVEPTGQGQLGADAAASSLPEREPVTAVD